MEQTGSLGVVREEVGAKLRRGICADRGKDGHGCFDASADVDVDVRRERLSQEVKWKERRRQAGRERDGSQEKRRALVQDLW
jgi:hypothetical protein